MAPSPIIINLDRLSGAKNEPIVQRFEISIVIDLFILLLLDFNKNGFDLNAN